MTVPIPGADLPENPLAKAITTGAIPVGKLGPLAWHLDELVSANAASVALMAQRHRDSTLADFYSEGASAERRAHRLLEPMLQLYRPDQEAIPTYDAVALAYPGLIARIAVTGTPWDYPVSLVHMCGPSTRNYRQLHQALNATGAFEDRQLDHFVFFSHTNQDEVAALQALLAAASAAEIARAYGLAQQLATCERLFWERMVSLCTPIECETDG